MAGRERAYRLLECTTALCAHCRERVDARVVEQDGAVYLRKYCPVHGEERALREKNASYYRSRTRLDKAATISRTQTAVRRGCPFDCGLCPAHEQHTCMGLIEVTADCELRCPACYAPHRQGAERSLGEIERMMDFFLEKVRWSSWKPSAMVTVAAPTLATTSSGLPRLPWARSSTNCRVR